MNDNGDFGGRLKNSGRAVIEDGSIVIRVAIGALGSVVKGAWAAGYFHDRWKVTDNGKLADGIVHALNAEYEDGTTHIHRIFDSAIMEAIEQGVEGIEKHENQEA